MSIRILGSFLIIIGCGWFGFSMAKAHRARENALRQFIRGLEWMEYELQFRQTPLPQLLHHTGNILSGPLRQLFFRLEQCLDSGEFSDVGECMVLVLNEQSGLPEGLAGLLQELGQSLGQFDLTGQLGSLRSLKGRCEHIRRQLSENRENRLRSYQTLGLCTGAALAVLLL